MAHKPGQDLLMQAASGLISVTGTPESGPTPVGAAIVDQHGGALMALGILGALLRKQRDGKGTRVEASLINSAIDLQGEPLVNYFAGGITQQAMQREKNLATWFHSAPYGVYPAKNGYVVISLCEDSALANAVESDEMKANLGTDRYKDRDKFARMLREATIKFTMDELAARLDEFGIWWSPVKNYDQLLDDPQLRHTNVFRTVNVKGRNIHLVNHPNRYDGQVPELRILALEVGEHSREILQELGYSVQEVNSLVESRAVLAAEAPIQEVV